MGPADLFRANLSGANLRGAVLFRADLRSANLSGADLREADLSAAGLSHARLIDANLNGADLSDANLSGANLSDANMRDANLSGVNLTATNLTNCDFEGSRLRSTTFAMCDLRTVRNLEHAVHEGPSSVDCATLRAFRGRAPTEFLRHCGIENWEIAFAELYSPDLNPFEVNDATTKVFDMRTTGPMFLGGVFISYNRTDSLFVDNLEKALKANGFVVWRDVHDLVAGPIVRQIAEAIRLQDSVIVVLSTASVNSDWVTDEVAKTRAREKEERRAFLCPISLDDSWKALDDLWTQLKREKNILDFSAWPDDERFGEMFGKLIRGLKLYYPPVVGRPPE